MNCIIAQIYLVIEVLLSPCLTYKFMRISQYSSLPLSVVSLSKVSVTCIQLQSKNIKRKISEMNNSQVLNCTSFWVLWWNLTGSSSTLSQMWSPFLWQLHAVDTPCPIVTEYSLLVIRSSIAALQFLRSKWSLCYL